MQVKQMNRNAWDLLTCLIYAWGLFIFFYPRAVTSQAEDSGEKLPFFNVPLTGIIDEGYSVSIDIGTPAQRFNILVDTGSSNLAVAGGPQFVSKYFNPKKSKSFQWLDDKISVKYSQGFWKGELAKDDMKFSVLPTKPINAKFVVIDYSRNFFVNGTEWQGILGLGYRSIAEEDVKPFWERYIEVHKFQDIFSISLCGLQSKSKIDLTGEDSAQGILTLGGVDPAHYVGVMQYTPVVRTTYFEVVITDIKVDDQSLAMDCKEYNFPRTIVDSGTTHLRLPIRVFNKVVSHLRLYVQGSIIGVHEAFWTGEEVICWEPPDQKFFLFPKISVSLLDVTSTKEHPKYFTISMIPEQYLGPVIFSDETLASESKCYRFSISPSDDGTILGSSFMEGFYVKFDRSNSQIGFALSKCTRFSSVDSTPGVSEVFELEREEVGNNYNPPFHLKDCQFYLYEPNEQPILIAAYVLICIACLCLLPLLVAFVHGQCLDCENSPRKSGNHDDQDQLVQ